MSIASELSALNGHIISAYDEISTMGGTVPANKNMSNLASAIASIPSGGGGGGAKVAHGVMDITADQSVAYGEGPVINHNLGVVPDFVLCYMTPYGATGALFATFYFNNNTSSYRGYAFQSTNSYSNSFNRTSWSSIYDLSLTETTFTVRGVNSTGVLKAGTKLYWLAGTFE